MRFDSGVSPLVLMTVAAFDQPSDAAAKLSRKAVNTLIVSAKTHAEHRQVGACFEGGSHQ